MSSEGLDPSNLPIIVATMDEVNKHIEKYRTKRPDTVGAVFVPYDSNIPVIEIYLDPMDLNADDIKKRYLTKKDESYMVVQEFDKKPPLVYHFLNNERAIALLRSTRDLYGHSILVHASLNETRDLTEYHSVTATEFAKLLEWAKREPIFDFKNNLQGTNNYIATVLYPNDFRYPGVFTPSKVELTPTGPFAALYTVASGKTFASKFFPQLKRAQSNLAHRLLRYYLGVQSSKLTGTEYVDTDTSYLDFTEEQEKLTEERMGQNNLRPKITNKMDIDSGEKMSIDSGSTPPKTNGPNEPPKTNGPNEPNYITVFGHIIPDSCEIMTLGKEQKVIKYITKPGKQEYPQFGCKVTVNYKTYLLDGSCLDEKSKAETFDIGITGCIRGLELALFNMKLNEKCLCVVPPDYAYGKLGVYPTIPPEATIVLYIENVAIQYKTTPAQKVIENQDVNDRIDTAMRLKGQGKLSFAKRHFGKCLKIYKDALKYLALNNLDQMSEDQWQRFSELGSMICVNLAISYAQMGIWERCRAYCTMSTEYQFENSKAYYWSAKANAHLNDFDSALKDINEAIAIGHKDKAVSDCFNEYVHVIHAHLNREKSMEGQVFEKIFEKLGETQDDKTQ
eukprot:gene6566-7612_t